MSDENKASIQDIIMGGNPYSVPTNRIKLHLDMDLEMSIRVMSEGVPGAEMVLHEIMRYHPLFLLDLNKMNVRGQQVWQLYKNYFNGDIKSFALAIIHKNQDMIDWVNLMLPNWPKAKIVRS